MNSISEEYAVAHATTGSAPSEPVVSVRGLVKRYGRHEAGRGHRSRGTAGEIFAFLGPNGAGKTTTVEILEGFQQRTAGCCPGARPGRSGRKTMAKEVQSPGLRPLGQADRLPIYSRQPGRRPRRRGRCGERALRHRPAGAGGT